MNYCMADILLLMPIPRIALETQYAAESIGYGYGNRTCPDIEGEDASARAFHGDQRARPSCAGGFPSSFDDESFSHHVLNHLTDGDLVDAEPS